MIKRISIKEVQYIAFVIARLSMTFNEPIPDFETRFPNVLESCIITPFQSFNRRVAYKGLTGKAAMLFYLMIKNHPFLNGNKRIAMSSLFMFLFKNNKWLKIDTKELYNFAVWVAESPRKLNHETVKAIEVFLNKHLVDL